MSPFISRRLWMTAAGGALLLTGARVVAHHGWAWAEGDQVELKGTVRDVYIGPPHPTLHVETARDGVWLIELGNPSQTERAGFTATSATQGDPIVVVGNRSAKAGEKRMKAVRVTIRDKVYDIYPERIRRN